MRYAQIAEEEKVDELIQTLHDNQVGADHPDQAQIELLTSLLHLFKSQQQSNRFENPSAVAS